MKIKVFLFIVAACALELLSQRGMADSIYVGAWSKHIEPSPYIKNSTHNLLAYEHSGYIVGYFRNSFDQDTGFIAKRFEVFQKGNFKAAIYLGIDYGYNTCDQYEVRYGNVFCPLVVPEIVYTKYDTQIVVSLLGNAVAIGPKWEF